MAKKKKVPDAAPQTPNMDGWASVLSGIGMSGHDKRLSHEFRARTITYQDAIEMWRGDDLAARAIDSVPNECFRQGYEVAFGNESKSGSLHEDLMEKIEELRVNDIVEMAMKMERAFGGSAILLGADDSRELSEPMEPERVKGLDWLTLLEPLELRPQEYYDDPKHPKYGEPRIYALTARATGSGTQGMGRAAAEDYQLIHETRLIVFPGIRVSRYQVHNNVAGNEWGDSILTRFADVLRDFNIAWSSAGIIVTDFSSPIFSITNLMQMVAKNESSKLRARLQALELGRSTARVTLIDKDEKFVRETTNVSGLPELLNQLSLRLAAAIDIPLRLLMGQGPGGIGSEGDTDIRFYYDRIASLQRRRVEPILRRIISLIMGTLRKRGAPKKWSIAWRPLWQLTDKEIADARLTQARADSLYLKHLALSPQEVRDSRWSGSYSYETTVDPTRKIPDPAEQAEVALEVAKAAAANPTPAPGTAAAPGAHPVGGYVRKDPNATKQAAVPEGGDVASEREDT